MGHKWTFFRAGGFDQVRFTSGQDLLALEGLDQKLWAALACPTRGIEFDTRTLDLIDGDKDGRIRAQEVVAAVKWASALLKDPGEILKGADSLSLSVIKDESASQTLERPSPVPSRWAMRRTPSKYSRPPNSTGTGSFRLPQPAMRPLLRSLTISSHALGQSPTAAVNRE
jgi:hypothetical protein